MPALTAARRRSSSASEGGLQRRSSIFVMFTLPTVDYRNGGAGLPGSSLHFLAGTALHGDSSRLERLALESVGHPVGDDGPNIEIVRDSMALALVHQERVRRLDLVVQLVAPVDLGEVVVLSG